MTRNRASAKKAGTAQERLVADYLATHVDDRIDRRVKTGSLDKGDIAGLRIHQQRIVIEVKNTTRINLGPWAKEAEQERINDQALAALIAHKRHGTTQPGQQWITCTLDDLVAIITGRRPGETQ